MTYEEYIQTKEIAEEDLVDDAEVDTLIRESIHQTLNDAQFMHAKIDLWTSNIIEGCLKKLAAFAKPFKYIVACNLQQRAGAGLHTSCCSRWADKLDGKVTVQWEKKEIFLLVTVYWVARENQMLSQCVQRTLAVRNILGERQDERKAIRKVQPRRSRFVEEVSVVVLIGASLFVVHQADLAAAATDNLKAAPPSYIPTEVYRLAENEDFWANMARYGRFFFSVIVGTVYTAAVKPLSQLLKRPVTAAAIIGAAILLYLFIQATLKGMLGLSDFDYSI